MTDSLKRFRLTYKSKAGFQYVTLLARNKGEAEVLGSTHQASRARRYDITHQRIAAALEAGDLTKEQHAAELERRKRDFARYDVVTQKQVAKDENGAPIMETVVGAASDPLKLVKIEEVK